jgi:transcriptional regulator with GAF, ATPase, and Fis domain
VERFARQFGRQIKGVVQETMDLLSSYDWPGNIRELQNVIERAVVLSRSPYLKLGADLLPVSSPVMQESIALSERADPFSAGAASLEQVERRYILEILRKTEWVIEGDRGAAKILDLNPNTLRSRMKKLRIERPSSDSGRTATKSRGHEAAS